ARTARDGLELLGRGRPADQRERRRYEVTGVVQGVGFRPFVYATATALALSGRVANTVAGVTIEVEGTPDALDTSAPRLRTEPPPLAALEAVVESIMDRE